jgi:hypothetical protein
MVMPPGGGGEGGAQDPPITNHSGRGDGAPSEFPPPPFPTEVVVESFALN